jgi:hypothetical protein
MPGVTTALAVLALIVSLLALGVALRVRRAPDAPPRPPPPPPRDLTAREALERLTAEAEETREAFATLAERVGDLGEGEQEGLRDDLRSLGTRVGRLEEGWGREAADLREAFGLMQSAYETLAAVHAQAPPEPAPEPEVEPEVEPELELELELELKSGARVREHLRRKGWEDVVLLPAPGDAPDGTHTWRVEARRHGGLAKGRARLFPDGRVEARLAPPTRAFP